MNLNNRFKGENLELTRMLGGAGGAEKPRVSVTPAWFELHDSTLVR